MAWRRSRSKVTVSSADTTICCRGPTANSAGLHLPTTARHTANLPKKKSSAGEGLQRIPRGSPSTAARQTANLFLTRCVNFGRPLTYLKRSF